MNFNQRNLMSLQNYSFLLINVVGVCWKVPPWPGGSALVHHGHILVPQLMHEVLEPRGEYRPHSLISVLLSFIVSELEPVVS